MLPINHVFYKSFVPPETDFHKEEARSNTGTAQENPKSCQETKALFEITSQKVFRDRSAPDVQNLLLSGPVWGRQPHWRSGQ